MSALLLRLAGPLQSWGTSSRFTRRSTDRVPSKSGVIGLLAAARGYRRTDSIEELLGLTLAVRTEQAGRVERDFQTASRPGEGPLSVSTRHYLADAVFLAAVEGPDELLAGLHDALRTPHFPLFLGRRSCPPVGPVALGLREGTAAQALTVEPWRASPWFQRSRRAEPTVELELTADCDPTVVGAELVHDEPVAHGFDPAHRQWSWRSVRRHDPVTVANPAHEPAAARPGHDPMGVL